MKASARRSSKDSASDVYNRALRMGWDYSHHCVLACGSPSNEEPLWSAGAVTFAAQYGRSLPAIPNPLGHDNQHAGN